MSKSENNAVGVIIFVVIVGVISGAIFGDHLYRVHQAKLSTANSGPYSGGTTNPSPTTTTNPTPSTPSSTCMSASAAASAEDQSGCVTFTGYQYTSSKGEMYLDQSTTYPYGFAVWIPAGTSFGPSVLNQYSGEEIDVTGPITNYKGEPQIEVTSASQITAAQ
jgi:hypothetical protein